MLVNVDIFTEGFDCPSVSFIQLARPTKSLALYIQQVGRGLRIEAEKEKTIIIDNVGLYNYFGLPDANRKWQYYFNGYEDVEHKERDSINRDNFDALDFEFDENRYCEDNEQMLVVRGANDKIENSVVVKERQKPVIKEFSVCNYYLVRGTSSAFKVYPFIKKRGKVTADIGNCVYDYNDINQKIVFSDNVDKNKRIVDGNVKLQSILFFIAILANMKLEDILNLENLSSVCKCNIQKKVTLFELLELISNINL